MSMWMRIRKIQKDPNVLDTFVCKIDSLWYKDDLYICKNSQLKQKDILELHTSPIGGNLGFLKTYHWFKKEFFGKFLNLMFEGSW